MRGPVEKGIKVHEALELRPATKADADFLAWGIDEAAEGVFAAILGRRSRAILATVMVQPEHQLSFQHAVVAVDGCKLLGFCLGWPAGTPKADMTLARAAGWRLPRLAAVTLLGWPVLAAMDRHAGGEWYMQGLAVVPHARGAGVGRRLVANALERAKAMRCGVFTTDVEARNVHARTLYEQLGLRVVSTSRSAPLLAGARLHRMNLVLSSKPGPGIG